MNRVNPDVNRLVAVISDFDSTKKDLIYVSCGKLHKWQNTGVASLVQRFFMWVTMYFNKKSVASTILSQVNLYRDNIMKSPRLEMVIGNLRSIFNRFNVKGSEEAANWIDASIKMLESDQLARPQYEEAPLQAAPSVRQLSFLQNRKLDELVANYELTSANRDSLVYDFHHSLGQSDEVIEQNWERKARQIAQVRNTQHWNENFKNICLAEHPDFVDRIGDLPVEIFAQNPKKLDFEAAAKKWVLIQANRAAFRDQRPAKFFADLFLLDTSRYLPDEIFSNPDQSREEMLLAAKKQILRDARKALAERIVVGVIINPGPDQNPAVVRVPLKETSIELDLTDDEDLMRTSYDQLAIRLNCATLNAVIDNYYGTKRKNEISKEIYRNVFFSVLAKYDKSNGCCIAKGIDPLRSVVLEAISKDLEAEESSLRTKFSSAAGKASEKLKKFIKK